MQKLRIKELLDRGEPGMSVVVQGWVRTRRDAKEFSFLEVNDGSCLANLQVIIPRDLPSFSLVSKVTTGSSVEIRGTGGVSG